MSRPKVNLTEKVQKELPEFVSEVASLSVEQLDARLAQLAKDADAVEQAKEADEALEQARERAAELNAPYVDSRKALRLKSRYIVELLKEKSQ
jgi:hypothetical protein